MKKLLATTTLFAFGAFAAPALAQVATDGSASVDAGATTSSDVMYQNTAASAGAAGDVDASASVGTTGTVGSDSSLPGLPNTGGGWGAR